MGPEMERDVSRRAAHWGIMLCGLLLGYCVGGASAATFTPADFTPPGLTPNIPKLTAGVMADPVTGLGDPILSYVGASVTYALATCGKYVRITLDPYKSNIVFARNDWNVGVAGSQGGGAGNFNHPNDMDVYFNDGVGVFSYLSRLVIADTDNNRLAFLDFRDLILYAGGQTPCTFSPGQSTIGFYWAGTIGAADGFSFSTPMGVSIDDKGTPTDVSDDVVWVADTGNNRIYQIRVNPTASGEQDLGTYGTLGAGVGNFNFPVRVVRGRTATNADTLTSRNNNDLFVLDQGNNRIVKLRCTGNAGSATWVSAVTPPTPHALLESIAVDGWGNVYVTDSQNSNILKYSPNLELLAVYGTLGYGTKTGEMVKPHDFRPQFIQRWWTSPPVCVATKSAYLGEYWSDTSGGQAFYLGAGVDNLASATPLMADGVWLKYRLSDHAFLKAEVLDQNGVLVRTMDTGASFRQSGSDSLFWDGRWDDGASAPRGVSYAARFSPRAGYSANVDGLDVATLSFVLPYPTTVGGGYMYLDTNGNGMHDNGDSLHASGSTTVDVWLKTNQNKNGSASFCDSSGTPNTISSYSVVLRAAGGTVAWSSFTNRMTAFTLPTGGYSDPVFYGNGMSGTAAIPAGSYRLASVTITPQSGSPYIVISQSAEPASSIKTTFGSTCPGKGFDNKLTFGKDWFDSDGAGSAETWTQDGVVVYRGPGVRGGPFIVPDGSGGMIMAWEDSRGGDSAHRNIYAQRVDVTGHLRWARDGVVVCSHPADQRYPRIVTDGAGGAIIAWEDHRGPFDQSDIYAQRVSANGSMLWSLNGVPICTAPWYQVFPSTSFHNMVADGQGGAIIVWEDPREGIAHAGDIYGQRVDSLGVVKWGTNGVAICGPNEPTYQYGPVAVSDGFGGALVAWMDFRNDPDPQSGHEDIYAQRVNASGNALWTADGIPVCIAPESQTFLDAVSDGGGGAVLAWQDNRTSATAPDIYAQRILGTMSIPWVVNGVPVAATTDSEQSPAVAADQTGGAVITYQDAPPPLFSSMTASVKAQRLDSSGNKSWGGVGKVGVTLGPGNLPTAVSNDFGGAVVTWAEVSTGIGRTQRLRRSDGASMWTDGGVRVGPALSFATMSDSAGGALVAWGVDSTIYASRIAPGGGTYVTDVPESPAPGSPTSLGPVYPNPFNPTVTIHFNLARACRARIHIYDPSGRLVRTLLNMELVAGPQTIRWDGSNDLGHRVASGVYFCRLEASGFKLTRTIALVR